MARINIIVPRMNARRFSGGLLCILQYAHGLVSLGHDVTLVPLAPSEYPEWFKKSLGTVIQSSPDLAFKAILRKIWRALVSLRENEHVRRSAIKDAMSSFVMIKPGLFPEPVRLGIAEEYVSRIAPPADIVLATSFETARPAALLVGKKFYFGQHYEPLFAEGFPSPEYAEVVAKQSYGLGLSMIANSSWLKDRLEAEVPGQKASLCPNAIDHDVFYGSPRPADSQKKVIVISYGGRMAEFKGFREMAVAMAKTRASLPDYEIEWRVYGDALVGPDEVTPYTQLGFLDSVKLSEEYRKADILFSASWYESFPLFPIEAMACGLAVVTTQPGTEEYAFHGKTAEVVPARDTDAISKGLVRLIVDPEYRFAIAQAGNEYCRNFTWERSITRLNEILTTSEDAG